MTDFESAFTKSGNKRATLAEAGELEMIQAATWGSWRQEGDAGGCRPAEGNGNATWN